MIEHNEKISDSIMCIGCLKVHRLKEIEPLRFQVICGCGTPIITGNNNRSFMNEPDLSRGYLANCRCVITPIINDKKSKKGKQK